LAFTPNKSAGFLTKLITSAYSNYKHNVAWELQDTDLLVSIDVGKGLTLKRARFTSRARVYTYYKHRSFVKVSLYA
jgi:ribosomal protein L22